MEPILQIGKLRLRDDASNYTIKGGSSAAARLERMSVNLVEFVALLLI